MRTGEDGVGEQEDRSGCVEAWGCCCMEEQLKGW